MKERFRNILEKIAKDNEYYSVQSLLMDYSFIPTVLMPKHKKFEIIKLLLKLKKEVKKHVRRQ